MYESLSRARGTASFKGWLHSYSNYEGIWLLNITNPEFKTNMDYIKCGKAKVIAYDELQLKFEELVVFDEDALSAQVDEVLGGDVGKKVKKGRKKKVVKVDEEDEEDEESMDEDRLAELLDLDEKGIDLEL